MKMQISRSKRHRPAVARISSLFRISVHMNLIGIRCRSCSRICRSRHGRNFSSTQIILQIQDEQISRTQPQSRRLISVRQKIAITNRSILLRKIPHRQIHFQNAVRAAQILRLRNRGSRRGPRARIRRNVLRRSSRRCGRISVGIFVRDSLCDSLCAHHFAISAQRRDEKNRRQISARASNELLCGGYFPGRHRSIVSREPRNAMLHHPALVG
jgi:hypothetical protein